jgi:predicted component of type VI protein secretion system
MTGNPIIIRQIYPESSVNEYYLYQGEQVVIGRLPENGVTWAISEPTMSRIHARIAWDADGLWVDDLHSCCGVHVNQADILRVRCALKLGDEIRLGQTRFQILATTNLL